MSDLTFDWNQIPGRRAVLVQDATLAEAPLDARVGPLTFDDQRAIVDQALRVEVDSVDLGWALDAGGLERIRYLLQGFRGTKAACSVPAETHILKMLAHKTTDLPIELDVMIAAHPRGNLQASLNCCRRARELGLRPFLTLAGADLLEPNKLHSLVNSAARAECVGILFFDQVGTMSGAAVRQLVGTVRRQLDGLKKAPLLAWAGTDRHGLALANALEAVGAGADFLRTSALGLGRDGYTPLELTLVNLKLDGARDEPLLELWNYVRMATERLGFSLPGNYPVFGTDAFRTATGVHAAAVAKAPTAEIADRVYSSVPAGWFGIGQTIEIGPMSGKWNVIHWLAQRCCAAPEPALVERILSAAKSRERVLNELEIFELLHA